MIAAAFLFLRGIPLKDWLYLAALLACAGAVGLAVHHEREIGRAQGRAEVQELWDAAVREDKAKAAKEVQRVAVAQKEVDHEAEKFSALAAVGAVHAADSAQRVQQRFAALWACPVPGAASAAEGGASAPAGDGRDVRADMFRVVVEAARRIGKLRDDARGAGLNAEGHYDSLKP